MSDGAVFIRPTLRLSQHGTCLPAGDTSKMHKRKGALAGCQVFHNFVFLD